MTNQEAKKCRLTQIETDTNNKDNNKQQENAPEKQEIQECYYTDT